MLATVLAPSAAAYILVRDDPPEGAWLTGYLSRNPDGSGRIVWDPSKAGDALAGRAAPDGTYSPPVFTSDPLPGTLYLNVSRHIQIDALIKRPETANWRDRNCTYTRGANADDDQPVTGSDPQKPAILRTGTTLLAGSMGDEWIDHDPIAFDNQQLSPEPDPIHLETCRYRMPPEIRMLPAGTVLRLEWQWTMAPMSLGGDTPSVLRISHYLPEELFWREPQLFDPRAAKPAGGSADPGLMGLAEKVLGPIGWAVSALFLTGTARRRRTATAMLAAAMLITGLSGCFGAPKGAGSDRGFQQDGQVSIDVQDANGWNFSGEGFGTILGVVSDPSFVPLSGVHVSLLGTALFTETSSIGRFSFYNVTPGVLRLRADKEGYQSLEFDAAVSQNKVTRVEAVMVPLDANATNARPHRHDYWGGETTIEIYNGTFGECSSQYAAPYLYQNYFSCAWPEFTIPEQAGVGPDLIMPGTNEVEVVLTWDRAQTGFSSMRLQVQGNHETWPNNWSLYMPRESGVPFHVLTNFEMTDVGHQQFSTWRIVLGRGAQSNGNPDPLTSPQAYVDWAVARNTYMPPSGPALHVVVRIHRGAVPLEPAHPDHWHGASVVKVEDGQSLKSRYVTTTSYSTNGCFYNPPPPYRDTPDWHFASLWAPFSQVVPSGTATLQVLVRLSDPTLEEKPLRVPYGLKLWYKPGNLPLAQWPGGTWDAAAAEKAGFKLAPAPTWTADKRAAWWNLTLESAEADGLYNKKSSWQMVTLPDDMEAACRDAYLRGAENPSFGNVELPTYSLTAWAKRDAATT